MPAKKRAALKRCTKCGKRKKPEAFSRNKNTKDGLSIWCKACAKEYKQRPEVKARAKEYQREYKRKYRLQPEEARKFNRPYIEDILMETKEMLHQLMTFLNEHFGTNYNLEPQPKTRTQPTEDQQLDAIRIALERGERPRPC